MTSRIFPNAAMPRGRDLRDFLLRVATLLRTGACRHPAEHRSETNLRKPKLVKAHTVDKMGKWAEVMPVGGCDVKIMRPGKVLFPAYRITRDLVYYQRIARWVLPSFTGAP